MDQNQINIFFKRFNKNFSQDPIYKSNKKNFKFKPTFIVALPRGAATIVDKLNKHWVYFKYDCSILGKTRVGGNVTQKIQ